MPPFMVEATRDGTEILVGLALSFLNNIMPWYTLACIENLMCNYCHHVVCTNSVHIVLGYQQPLDRSPLVTEFSNVC